MLAPGPSAYEKTGVLVPLRLCAWPMTCTEPCFLGAVLLLEGRISRHTCNSKGFCSTTITSCFGLKAYAVACFLHQSAATAERSHGWGQSAAKLQLKLISCYGTGRHFLLLLHIFSPVCYGPTVTSTVGDVQSQWAK